MGHFSVFNVTNFRLLLWNNNDSLNIVLAPATTQYLIKVTCERSVTADCSPASNSHYLFCRRRSVVDMDGNHKLSLGERALCHLTIMADTRNSIGRRHSYIIVTFSLKFPRDSNMD